jgi:hypothetical protein
MNANLVVAIISASATILVATIAYYSAKQREREAEWRKEKLNYYKEYFNALAACVGTQVTDENRKRYSLAFNTVGLFASQEVIECLHSFQEISRLPAEKIQLAEHDLRLTKLVLAVRRDLKLKPKDTDTFEFHMIAARIGG